MSRRVVRFMRRVAPILVTVLISSVNLSGQQTTQAAPLLPSDRLNQKLPKWLSFSGELRGRAEGFTGGGFKAGNDDQYFLSRVRLNMKIQPTSWLKLMVQGQDAHALGKDQNPPAPPFQDTMDIRLGYIELGNTENKAFGFRMGRQELAFGEERLVGNANWLNTARSFDGVRATYRHKNYRVDGFAASVVNIREGRFDRSVAGNNFYGVYGVVSNFVFKSTVEPYFFWRRAANLPMKLGGRGNLDFATLGFRWEGKVPAGFDYGMEIAAQTGSLGTDAIHAWAGHWVVGYTFARARFKPRIMAEYNYATGETNPGDSKRRTFDQLYPTNHDKYGLADQVGWKNIHHLRSGVEVKPLAKVVVACKYSSYWLASPRDAFYNAAGAVVARVANGSAGRYVGQEVDFQAVYKHSKQTQVGGGFAHLFPGTFLNTATPGHGYSYPYVSLTYTF